MRARSLAYATPVLALAVLTLSAIGGAAAAPVRPNATAVGAVFTMTNGASGNAIVAYDRASSGALTWVANYSTGGTGTGASLADQGSVVLTPDHAWLLVVDAGSSQISVFRVHAPGSTPLLTLTDTVASGGTTPVSLAVHGALVFVVNVGPASGGGNIAGFTLSSRGTLAPIAGSDAPLSTASATGAAEIAFDPAGHVLAVTEKTTSLIDLYRVNPHGVVQTSANYTSGGSTPYGFAFDARGQLIVSDAAAGALSSYRVGPPAALTTVSAAVDDYQAAPCWVAVAPAPRGGTYAFTTNGHTDTISSYWVGVGGKLTLLQQVAATGGSGPTDEVELAGAHELIVYDAGADAIQTFTVGSDATLTWSQTTSGLVATAEGLAAY